MRILAGAFSLLWAGRAWAGCDDQTIVRGELIYETILRDVEADRGIRVVSSPGGTGAAAIALAQAYPLVIDGVCNSSCAWAFVTNERACFTSRAVFGFHAAHDPGTGKRMTSATTYWLDHVRPGLRPQLERLRTSSGVIRISAAEMERTYGGRVCGQEMIAPCGEHVLRTKATANRHPHRPIVSAANQRLWDWPMILGTRK